MKFKNTEYLKAGIYYGIGGENGIPEDWIAMLARKEWILERLGKAQ